MVDLIICDRLDLDYICQPESEFAVGVLQGAGVSMKFEESRRRIEHGYSKKLR